MEVWQSPVYCTCLENRRSERVREFESHRFRQVTIKKRAQTGAFFYACAPAQLLAQGRTVFALPVLHQHPFQRIGPQQCASDVSKDHPDHLQRGVQF